MISTSISDSNSRLFILWEEYRANIPKPYGYSRFCELYAESTHSQSRFQVVQI